MIAYIEGRLLEIRDNYCIIVTPAGLGYEMALSASTLGVLPPRGESVALYVSLAVREDALELFGFATFDEKRMFEILLTVSKVGARTAMAVLSVFRPDDLRRIVVEESPESLTRVPGIGKKNAQHIFLELKYKLKASGGSESVLPAASGRMISVFRDTMAGLVGLGYAEEECSPTIKKILQEEPDMDVAGAIRLVLKQLGKGAAR